MFTFYETFLSLLEEEEFKKYTQSYLTKEKDKKMKNIYKYSAFLSQLNEHKEEFVVLKNNGYIYE